MRPSRNNEPAQPGEFMALPRHKAPTYAHDHVPLREHDDRARRDERSVMPDVPHIGLFQALGRHWFVALLPVLAFVALGATYAITRSPVYTASTTLSVVQFDLNSPGALAGFPAASQSLASAYSRAVDSEALTAPVAKRLGRSVASVAAETSATPVPQSPVVKVRATGDSARRAVVLANTMSRQLVAYVARLGKSNAKGRKLLEQYREAERDYQVALAAQGRAQRAYDEEQSARNQAPLISAKSAARTARLKSDSVRTRYEQSQQALTAGTVLQLLSPSRTAESDRRSKFELAVLLGLAAGLIVGAALASWRFDRVARRTALALRERR
jgi:capsular polysaccharide biosynthesis protein